LKKRKKARRGDRHPRKTYRYSLSRISLSAGDTLSKHAMLKKPLSSPASHGGGNERRCSTLNPNGFVHIYEV